MNIAVIADDEFAALKAPVMPADVLVSLGDMPDLAIQQIALRCRCQQVLAVKGNHDSSRPFKPPIRDMHLQTFTLDGVTFGGFCGSWKYKPKGNYLFEQDEAERLLATFPAVDVFIAHNAPRLVHDRDDEVHIGFSAFGNYIARHQPRYFFHGHTHVSPETRLGATRVIGVLGQQRFDLEPVSA